MSSEEVNKVTEAVASLSVGDSAAAASGESAGAGGAAPAADKKSGGRKKEKKEAAAKATATAAPQLAIQDLSSLVVERLTPLTPEVISRQATINIGTIGHVAHGKSTVVKAISGVHTVRFVRELERNITIKLGYANAKIYKASDAAPNELGAYRAGKSSTPDSFEADGRSWTLQRHISFVDCPGHDILMATMLNGAAVMDAALLLVAGNESCPQPQTREHLAAVELMELRHIIILQNKVDLVRAEDALRQRDEIAAFVRGTVAESAPVIPICAVDRHNVDVVAEYIARYVPIPVRDFSSPPFMIIIRSFDVNKPGEEVKDLRGGVAGGSILRGVLRRGDAIEVRPGAVTRKADNTLQYRPHLSRVVSLFAEENALEYAVPGGLLGVGTKLDPSLTRADALVGQVLGLRDGLPSVFARVDISFYLLRRLLGVRASEGGRQPKVSALERGEVLMVNIGSTTTGARVEAVKGDTASLTLIKPVCTEVGEKIALSRRFEGNWRLIGWGLIRSGDTVERAEEGASA